MSRKLAFDTQEAFVEKLEELVKEGVDPKTIDTMTPFHVHEAEHILHTKPSELRFFTLAGAILGFVLGFAFMVYTVVEWPLITGGKPLISIPAFIIVAFECTILIGGIVSFIGFLHLNRLPNIKRIIEPRECGNQFLIYLPGEDEDEKEAGNENSGENSEENSGEKSEVSK